MILLVTYDLNGRPEGYDAFYETLKQQGGWSHYLKSTWLISTDKTVEQIFDELKPHLNIQDKGGDLILVTIFTQPHHGWLPKPAWAWVRKNEVEGPKIAEHSIP
jgi:hypothetical protein